MNKLKKLLCCVILLAALTALFFVFLPGEAYAEQFMNVAPIRNMIIREWGKAFLWALVPLLVWMLVRFFIKAQWARSFLQTGAVNTVLAGFASFLVWTEAKKAIIGLPDNAYTPDFISDPTYPSVEQLISVTDFLIALEIGLLASLVLWIIESSVRYVVKNKIKL